MGASRRGVHPAVLLHPGLFVPLSDGFTHFRQFLGALVPAAAWELQRRGAAVRTGVACIWAPGFALMMRACVMPAAAASLLATVNLPTGGTIHTSAALAERILIFERFTFRRTPQGAPVLFVQRGLGGASGWHYAYTVPHATRHTWFFASNVDQTLRRSGVHRSVEPHGRAHRVRRKRWWRSTLRAARWICRFRPRSHRRCAAG